MTNKMPTWLRHWEITREKGPLKFILQHGILTWGLFMFILTTFMAPERRFSIFVSACIWIVAGGTFGAIMWITAERRYKRFLAKQFEATEA